MKKIFLMILVFIFIIGGCTAKNSELTWEKVYKMIDQDEFGSVIDQAIFDIGPETHPASQTIIEYYNSCMNADYEKAWSYIEDDSPFMLEKENLEKFIEVWEKSIKLFEYESPVIKGIHITKLGNNKRGFEVIFSINIKTIDVDNEYSSNGRFKVINTNKGWKIHSSIPLS